MQTSTQDVVDVLLDQHRQVKQLLDDLSGGAGDRAAMFCDLRRLIAVHETAEQEVVYPVLRASGASGRSLADAVTAEEKEGIGVLAKLEDLDVGSKDFGALFANFRSAVLEHAHHEETAVFPLLRETQDASTLSKMARWFEVAEKAAPTHPHPHAPTSTVGNLMAGPALAIMDRVRDALHR